jgi:ribonuclease HIII
MTEKRHSHTIKLTPDQMEAAARILREGNYRPRQLDHTIAAASGADCQIAIYKSGKCLVQGKGAEEWITFVLEPQVLLEARLGYEEILNPESVAPHMGVDESGKGDFFGPLVIAAAYVDEPIARDLKAMNVRDSKTITTDKAMQAMARQIRDRLGDRYTVVAVGPSAYNRLYGKMNSVNRILAWGHAKAIENLLEKVPECPRALSDQFGPEHQIQRALQQKGRKIKLEQRHRAESDVAVAAASILARSAFLTQMDKLGDRYGVKTLPKGASAKVKSVAGELVGKYGGTVFLETAKCHFKTTDDVLGPLGKTRDSEGLPAAPERKAYVRRPKK